MVTPPRVTYSSLPVPGVVQMGAVGTDPYLGWRSRAAPTKQAPCKRRHSPGHARGRRWVPTSPSHSKRPAGPSHLCWVAALSVLLHLGLPDTALSACSHGYEKSDGTGSCVTITQACQSSLFGAWAVQGARAARRSADLPVLASESRCGPVWWVQCGQASNTHARTM